MGYIFSGENKLITISLGTVTFEITDLYSRWKDWVRLTDNSKWVHAFTSVAGDPIGGGQTISPYIFLNNLDAWRIRPAEEDHELKIVGNLYPIESTLAMFVPTVGDFTVSVMIERSSAAINTGGGRFLR